MLQGICQHEKLSLIVMGKEKVCRQQGLGITLRKLLQKIFLSVLNVPLISVWFLIMPTFKHRHKTLKHQCLGVS